MHMYNKGIQLSHTHEKTRMENLKIEYIKCVSDNIENRMSIETSHNLSAFGVLNHKQMKC